MYIKKIVPPFLKQNRFDFCNILDIFKDDFVMLNLFKEVFATDKFMKEIYC